MRPLDAFSRARNPSRAEGAGRGPRSQGVEKATPALCPVYQEGAVDQDLLVEGARNLKDYFQSQGYPDVEITFRQLPVQNDQLTVQYFISQGTRQKLAHIDIAGNRYFPTDTIRERMFLQPSFVPLSMGPLQRRIPPQR